MNFLDFGDNLNQEEEEYEDSINQKVNEVIDSTIGENISNSKKEKLIEYLSDILIRNERKLISCLNTKNYRQPTKSAPQINIICYPSIPQNRTYMQPPTGYLQPINAIPQQNTCSPNCLPTQMSIPNYNFFYPNQPFLQPQNAEIKISKKHNKNSDKKKSKTKSKKKDQKKSKKRSNSIEFVHQQGHEFEGIINYLTEKTQGNIHDNGTIEVTSDKQDQQSKSAAKNVLDGKKVQNSPRNTNYFMAKRGETEFWICFDFKKMRVKISSYTIQNTKIANVPNIKNWVIETSDDGQKWSQIDEQKDCMAFKNTNQIKTFDVKKCHFVRFVRFRQTGGKLEPANNQFSTFDCIGIQSFEFYGKLKHSV